MKLIERLTVNGDVVPISGYSMDTPTDGMGQSVTIALAKPDITSIPFDAEITFEVGASKYITGAWIDSYAPPIITEGKLKGRNYSVKWIPDNNGGYPGDVIEFSSISPVADKWSISPPQPIVMYNPQVIEGAKLLQDPGEAIRLNGVPLLPLLLPKEDLNSKQVIDYGYGACGFPRIISNLIDIPVDRVDFTLEGGYHAAVNGVIGWLEPEVFEHLGILWIIDPEEGLPSGLEVKTLSPNAVVEVAQSFNPEITSNAVILSYKNPAQINAGELPHEFFIDEPPIEGGEGKGYTRIEVRRHITEFRDINSDELIRTEEHEIVTSHFAYRDTILVVTNPDGSIGRTRTPGAIRLVSRETIANRYVGNTKSGHTRTIEAVYSNPDNAGRDAFGVVLVEENSLIYGIDNNHAGESLLEFSETKTIGVVLQETKDDGLIVYTPIVDANSGNLVESDGSQTLKYNQPIETVTERLRQTSANQSNVETVIIDHLGGSVRTIPPVQSRVGSRSTYNPSFSLDSKYGHRPGFIRELIEDEASVAEIGLRKPITFDVGPCPPETARRLARRKVRKLTKPPKRLTITLPGIDFSLRRGSLVICPLRTGYDGKAIVTGYKITASGIGTPQARRVQVLDARELIIDNS